MSPYDWTSSVSVVKETSDSIGTTHEIDIPTDATSNSLLPD